MREYFHYQKALRLKISKFLHKSKFKDQTYRKKEFRMKAFYRFGLIFVLVLTIFFSYQFIKVFYTEREVPEQNSATYPTQENSTDKKSLDENISDENARVIETSNNAQTLTCDTLYVIKEYDKTTKTEETVYEQIPEQYIGKTRSQIEEIAESYSQAPALKDIEKGFASMEVLSFSPEKLIVQKKYYSDLTKEHFYLVVENEYVTVYYSDLQTVYLYTDIYFANLPEGLKQEILDKKYIESEEELYNFLESYTS